MENRAYALAAGLFVLLLGAALAAAAFWLSGDSVVRVTYRVESTQSVSGLNIKAPVRWRGVNVGKVERIHFDAKDPHRVLIDIKVDRSVPLPRGTYAQLGFLGITGLSFVQLDDAGSSDELLRPPGPIAMQPSLLDHVSRSGEQLVDDAGHAVERLNLLLSDRNLAAAGRILDNLAATSDKLAAAGDALPGTVRNADRALQQLQPLLADLDALAVALRARVGAVDRAGDGLQRLGQAGASLQRDLTQRTLPRLDVLAERLARDTQLLNQVLRDVHERPQSFIFGRSEPAPGPGEPGFQPPAEP